MASAKKIQSDLCSVLFEASSVAMFLYDRRSLRILAANEVAQLRYGYSGQELHSMTVRNLSPGSDSPALNSCLLLDRDAPSPSLWTHVNKRGESFDVELSVVPVRCGGRPMALLSVTDASNWSEARLNLIRSEQIHRSLVEHCPFGVYCYDLVTQRYEQANPALLALLGYSLDELRSLDRPTICADLTERDRYLSELRASGSLREIQTRLRCRDGRTLVATVSGYLFQNPETGHLCAHVYVRDTTRPFELEEQLGAMHRMEAVGRFAGGVAHDFNNITQSISLSCELALRASLPLAVRTKLFGIMQQANRAAEITQRLLAFSRRQLLRPRALHLNDCIQEALPALSRSLGINISMDLRLGDALPPAFIDPDQLTLVLIHLADNARVAMPDGGVLRISSSRADEKAAKRAAEKTGMEAAGEAPAAAPSGGAQTAESSAPSQPRLLLTVSDTGIGMDEATRQRIFEPFFSTKKTAQTAGLGLATVYGIIHQSNGHIECESSPGGGTTFRIYLPIAQDAHSISSPASERPGE
jgi:two-component system cell cycle sensor histidine kinase/response regulator CckA